MEFIKIYFETTTDNCHASVEDAFIISSISTVRKAVIKGTNKTDKSQI